MKVQDTSSAFQRVGGTRDYSPFKYLLFATMCVTTLFMVLTLLTSRTPLQEKVNFVSLDDGVEYKTLAG